MTTEKQYAANRANAMASTGPRSDRGKAISGLNALRHGAFATQRLLPGENASQYEQLSDSVLLETAPKTAIESMIVDQIIGDIWRIMRIERAELFLFERLRKREYERTLRDLPSEEFEIAEKLVKDDALLLVARRQRWTDERARNAGANAFAEYQKQRFPLHEVEQPSGDTPPRLTSSERAIISSVVARKLEESSDLGFLLLETMAYQAEPYTSLESMRRSLARDIVRQYASLVQVQERRQTIESIEME